MWILIEASEGQYVLIAICDDNKQGQEAVRFGTKKLLLIPPKLLFENRYVMLWKKNVDVDFPDAINKLRFLPHE